MKQVKLHPVLIIVLCLSLFSACSNAGKKNVKTVESSNVKSDGGASPDGEVAFRQGPNSASTFGEQKSSSETVLADNSKVTTTYDGYGNKIETRYFNNHPNVKLLISSTATNGRREVLIYGQNGERKRLSAERVDLALTASGTEIANEVGITGFYRERPAVAARQPQPVYPPVKMPPLPQNNEQTTIQETAAQETPPRAAEQPPPAPKPEPSARNPQPDQSALQKQINQATLPRE